MSNNNNKKEIAKPEVKETKTPQIRLLCNPTGKYNMANEYGDVLTLSPELTKRMLDEGDAEIVK
jgi:hypothetical protein